MSFLGAKPTTIGPTGPQGPAGPAGATGATGPAGAAGYSFPSGTACIFAQTAAPTGFTKVTTHNDKALRVVSGTASSGGTTAFSTVFTNQTPTINTAGLSAGATTLSTAQMPSHNHAINGTTSVASTPGTTVYIGVNVCGSGSSSTSGNAGGGGSHSHSISGSATSSAITLNVAYVDVIIATKD